jgi:flagellin-like hook-associated protein FlgL
MNVMNKERKVLYMAVGFATGIADFVVTVRKPDGSVLDPAPVMSESGDGVYSFSYTPDVAGLWQEKITSATNGDRAIRGFDVVTVDVSDVNTTLGTVEGKVDAVKTQTDSIETKVDAVKVVVDTTDGKVDVATGKIDAIKSVVDAINVDVGTGGYFLN